MRKEIEATEVIYEKLFDEQYHLRLVNIPSFQRKYVWGKTNIVEVMSSIDSSEDGSFFGNLMIQHGIGGVRADSIVDGQQRIVTFSLITFCLKKDLTRKNQKTINEIIYCKNEPRIRFNRIELDSVYKKILNEDSLSKTEQETAKNILVAVKAIRGRIATIDDKNAFFKKLLGSNFVLIKLPPDYSVYSVFESLNSRGTPLKPIELTKNSLLGFAHSEKEVSEEIELIWDRIQNIFEQDKKTNDFDAFLRYSSFQRYGYLNNSKLFYKISTDTEVKNNPLNYSKNLLSDAILWLRLRKGDFDKPVESTQTLLANIDFYKGVFQKLSLRQIYSVIFSIHKALINISEYKKRDYYENDLKKLFAFSVLAKILKISPPKYERIYAQATKEFCDSADKQELNTARAKLFASLNNLINDTDKQKFSKTLYDNVSYDGLHISKSVNLFNDSSFIVLLLLISQGREVKDTATIEHIIPRNPNWRMNWPHILDDLDTERFRLGNMTILYKDLAGELGFEEKIKEYKLDNYSRLFINQRIIKKTIKDSHYKVFMLPNPTKEMEERGLKLGHDIFQAFVSILKKDVKLIK